MVNTEFYKNAKIYKIVDNTNGNIYIGSTCKKLCRRIAQHRANYKQYLNGKFSYITSFKILENGDYDIILIEEVKDCENKEQLRARERYYIENVECVNKRIEGRTAKEYYNDNKVVIAAKNKEHYEANKDTINAKHREYYDVNKDVFHEKQSIYRAENKDRINESKKIKYNCLCGSSVSKTNKAEHEKSEKHIQYCNENNIELNKHKDNIPNHIKYKSIRNAKHICEICNGHYTLSGKSEHLKSKKHLSKLEIKDN